MSARDDYPKLDTAHSGPHHQGQTSQEAQAALDEIDRLRRQVEGADEIDRLLARIAELEEIVETDAADLEYMREHLQQAAWSARESAEQAQRTLELLDQRGKPMVVAVTPGDVHRG